jgi:hypothetical protein
MEERITRELKGRLVKAFDPYHYNIAGKPPSEISDLLLDNCKATSISGLTEEFTGLTTLSLINVGLTTLEGLPKVSRHNSSEDTDNIQLPSLRTIDLSDNKLGGGLEKLVECCPRLYHINLCANKITVRLIMIIYLLKNW